MSTSCPTHGVTDPEYRNWLRVGLALSCMKKSLHSFIEDEVKSMHRTLVHNIYNGPTVSQPKCTQCTANDIKLNRHKHVWVLNQCPALCHVWLTELLRLQNNRSSDKIYWSNCDVASWPTAPWEVAKAYMPRGQKPTNKSPEDCDSQALLTLLANCKHFHRKLSPQGLAQTHKVSKVRNDTMHAPNLKVTDAEMRKYIQNIIDFLEDPVNLLSLKECNEAVSEIKKIRDATMDVMLNLELEIKALKELRGDEIEKVKQDVDCVHQVLDSHASDLQCVHQVLDSHANDQQGVHQALDLHTSDLEGVHQVLDSHTSELKGVCQVLDSHTNDQQGVCQALDSHTSDLEGVHQILDSHTSDLYGVHRAMDSYTSGMQGVHSNLIGVQQVLDTHTSDLHSVHQTLDSHTSDMQSIHSNLIGVQQALNSHTSDLQCVHQVFDSHASNLQDVHKVLDSHTCELQGVQQVLDSHTSDMQSVHQVLDSHASDLQDVHKVLDSHTCELQGVQQVLDSHTSDMQSVHQVLDSHASDMQDVHQVLDSHTNDQRGVRQAVDSHTSELEGVHQLLDSHTSDLEGVQRDLQLVQQVVDTHTYNLQHVKQVLETPSPKAEQKRKSSASSPVKKKKAKPSSLDLHDSGETPSPKAEQKRKSSASSPVKKRKTKPSSLDLHDSGDLRNLQMLLIDAYKSVETIPVSPVFEMNLKDLEDFYTDVVIEEESKEPGLWRNLVSTKKKIKVTSFKQIFKKGKSRVTRIILKSPAGLGKSTFCRKVVQTWCYIQNKSLGLVEENEFSSRAQTDGLKDEDEMLQFDIVLYITLRECSDEEYLMDMICTQFPLVESKDHKIRSHLEGLIGQAEDNRVLLIIDGLDEFDSSASFIDKILKRRLYASMTVLATTRPWKIGQLQLSQHAHIDLLLDLQGFSSENGFLFVEKILDKYYGDKSSMQRFKDAVHKNPLIGTLKHIPLLLLFIVHVWYEHKSFPQTIHELYVEILNMMVDRYTVSKKRKQKGKDGQDDHCGDISNKWTVDDPTFAMVPKVDALHLGQNFGGEFLVGLCEVADHFLITDWNKHSLVFDENNLIQQFGKDGILKLQRAVEIGLLSKTDSPAVLKKRTTLSFLHKTIQEFLAAINLCTKKDRLVTFLDSLKTVSDVFQNENIVMFVSGISPSQCEKIFEKIYEVCETDKGVHREETFEYNNASTLCRLYRSCVREANGCSISLKLPYLCVQGVEDWNVLHSNLKSAEDVRLLFLCDIDFTSKQCQTSLNISQCHHLSSVKLNRVKLNNVTLDFSNCRCLTRLSLVSVTMSAMSQRGKFWFPFLTNTRSLVLSDCPQLQYLTLERLDFNNAILNLSGFTNLTDLRLLSVNIGNSKLVVKQCPQLRCMTLLNDMLSDAILDLSGSSNLTEVNIRLVNYMKQFESELPAIFLGNLEQSPAIHLCNLVQSQCPQLRCVHLQEAKVHSAILDLSMSTSLTEVTIKSVTGVSKLMLSQCPQLRSLKLENANLRDPILDLSGSPSLTEVTINTVNITDEIKLYQSNQHDAIEDLSTSASLREIRGEIKLVLSQCAKLKSLTLRNININFDLLDLSSSTCLMTLSLDNVTIAGKSKLVLSQYTKLNSLTLLNINHNVDLLELSRSTSMIEVTNSTVNITGEIKLVLSQCVIKETKLNIDLPELSRSTSLIDITINTVNITSEIKLVLSQYPELRCLKLNQSNLHNAILDLSMSTSLREVTINDVTGVSKLELSQCPQLRYLHMEKANLHNARLDLSMFTSLTGVTINAVTGLSKLVLSQCPQLRCLHMDKVNLHNAILDLSMSNSLTKVTIKTVTDVGKLVLSQCPQLSCLKLEYVSLRDAILDLSGSNRLTKVTINTVNITGRSLLVLCTQLENLTMKKGNFSADMLDLSSSTCLTELYLDSVMIAGMSKLVLSQYTRLKSLTLLNVNLNVDLLELSRSTCLTWLYIQKVNVTNSNQLVLPQFTQLKELSLKEVNFCDTLLDMSESTCLTVLEICCVTMAGMSKLVLSKCTNLKKLVLEKVTLNSAIIDLSESTWLSEFKLIEITTARECNLNIPESTLSSFMQDNVSLCMDSKIKLCKSLSRCKNILSLSLKNLDLGDAVLSLDNLNCGTSLELDNVIMCNDSKVKLCDSLSRCSVLLSLSVKNLDLGDALLSLDNLHRCTRLVLDNVTMCNDSKVKFCNSLSQNTEWYDLQLQNLDLGDALGDALICRENLKEVDKFSRMKLNNIIVSSHCAHHLQSSLQYQECLLIEPIMDEMNLMKVSYMP